MITLRDYQEIAVDSIFNYFTENTGNPIVAMPTGTGKSVVIAAFIQRVLQQWPAQRFMILTHVKELIDQNAKKMTDIWPHAPVGIFSAGLGMKQTYMPITFGGIASVVKAMDQFGPIDILLVDECHLISTKANSMYQQVIRYLKERNPYLKVVGFTATWWRMGQGSLIDASLIENEHTIFTDVAINMTDMLSFNWFIEQGYLVPLIPKPTQTHVDVTDVGISKGDYNQGELQDATERVTYGALREAVEYASNRRKWLVFAAGNKNAETACDILNQFGIRTTFIHDGVKGKERDDRLKAFREGHFGAITNNNILTTGFDDPEIDCIIMLRKTLSPGLWVQMLGRGTRPVYTYGYDISTPEGRLASIAASSKRNCLVLDFARNTKELGPINDPRLPKRKGAGGGDAPVKICEHCGTYNHASVRFCIDCGAEFPVGVNFMQSAGEDELIKTEAPEIELRNISSIILRKHHTKGSGIPMLKVTYQCPRSNGIQSDFFDEYIGFEHTGFMLHKAHMWWAARHHGECPKTVDEVLSMKDELRTPIQIRVWTNKKYPEIMGYEYE